MFAHPLPSILIHFQPILINKIPDPIRMDPTIPKSKNLVRVTLGQFLMASPVAKLYAITLLSHAHTAAAGASQLGNRAPLKGEIVTL